MTDVPDRAARAFEATDAFVPDGDGFRLTTTAFPATVAVAETDGWALRYALTVRAPMLSSAVADDVGDAVEAGWFDTFALRAEDAPMAVRESVELTDFDAAEADGDAVVTLVFEWGNADRAPAIAKAFAEFVEGTYVEGVIPGYEYVEPVADLLSAAETGGGTPL